MTGADAALLDHQLDLARSSKPPATVGEALQEGWDLDVHDTSGWRHLVRTGTTSWTDYTSVDFAAPRMLLAAGGSASDQILALVYWVEDEGGASPPEGFAGNSDVWHRHHLICEIGDEHRSGDMREWQGITVEACAKEGGSIYTAGGWMLHVWVVPDVPSPTGHVFDEGHA